eukprot:NODE_10886_length_425_cov_8.047872_g9768_i0.p1 GENE.NODE_10886_length_425_cov_8.047872_g9768_i0~~NODE_10886_length_425_cov_8.047872_g9768_i0.p1  ORF type:complete len:54 (-),score=1.01 NODE_10886_length_425_cov_8.047872_g9768_i0:188-349(-)
MPTDPTLKAVDTGLPAVPAAHNQDRRGALKEPSRLFYPDGFRCFLTRCTLVPN